MSDKKLLAKYRLWLILHGLIPITYYNFHRCENCKPFVEHLRKTGNMYSYDCKYLRTQNLFDVDDAGVCVRWIEYV